MTPETWQKIEDAFNKVKELSAEERTSFMNRLRASDAKVCDEVEKMIHQSDPTDPFVESSSIVRERVAKLPEHLKRLHGHTTEPEWPERIGPYKIREEIDRGGMGVILRAEDAKFRRGVAVKVMMTKHRDNLELSQRFDSEAVLTGQLQHPGIPPVFDVGRLEDGRPWLAMKLVEGETLAKILRKTPNADDGFRDRIAVFEQVCQTVSYAHACGVIHRDLKPSNIMVGEFGEVQVMDWGLAKRRNKESGRGNSTEISTKPLDGEPQKQGSDSVAIDPDAIDLTQPGQIMGTLEYMPPEQAVGDLDQLDERCDVFSLGGILCAMLTGEPPYRVTQTEIDAQLGVESDNADTRKLNRVRQQIILAKSAAGDVGDAIARLKDTEAAEPARKELVALTKKCLACNKEHRPANAGEVADAVVAYQRDMQQRERRAELGKAQAEVRIGEERKRRKVEQARRRLTVVAAGLLLLLVTGAGGAWSWNLKQQAETVKQRVLRLEEKAKSDHSQKVIAARNAAEDGNWRLAMDWFSKAIADDFPDKNELAVMRLRAFFALNRQDELRYELLRLLPLIDNNSLPNTNIADYWLVRGELTLSDMDHIDDGKAMLKKALAVKDGLSLADRQYAKSLLASRPYIMVQRLNSTLNIQPKHHSAMRTHLFVRIIRGELKLAKAALHDFKLSYPNDPASDLAAALMEALSGNQEFVAEKLAPLKGKLSEEDYKRTAQYLFAWSRLIELMQRSFDEKNTNVDQFAVDAKVLQEVLQFYAQFKGKRKFDMRAVGLPAPIVSLFKGLVEEVLSTNSSRFWKLTLERARNAEIKRLEEIYKDYPEATFLYLAMMYRMVSVKKAINADRPDKALPELHEIAKLWNRAKNSPSLLRKSPLPFQARVLAATGDAALLRFAQEPLAAVVSRLRDNLDRLVAEGRSWPKLRHRGLELVTKMMNSRPTKTMQKEWDAILKKDPNRRKRRRQLIAVLLIRLLNQWHMDEPKNSFPLVYIANTECWAGNFHATRDAIRRARTVAPNHPLLTILEKMATEGLEEKIK